jgi:hypothetical protein
VENAANHSTLLTHLFESAPHLTQRSVTIVSDRDKGIFKAVSEFVPHARDLAYNTMAQTHSDSLARDGQVASEVDREHAVKVLMSKAQAVMLPHVNCLQHLFNNIHQKFLISDAALYGLMHDPEVEGFHRKLDELDSMFDTANQHRGSLSAYLASNQIRVRVSGSVHEA